MSAVNEVESDEEKDEPEDQVTPQIGSLREALAAMKGLRKYISSVEIQICTLLFSSTVELENVLTNEMTSRQSLKQAKVTVSFLNFS